MLHRLEEQRHEERIRAAFPVDLGGATGLTRDVSASGIFFETEPSFTPGNPIRMLIDIDTPGGPITMNYTGRIIRLERREGRLGVAVRIVESEIASAQARALHGAP